ncbi:PrpF domain-containing protein [Modestobacter marinus]|uniref:PrpF domain-containing protein n=1 Tax=Modestobacter marinus TaxID=477641 RepID=UPI001C97FF09|nr:PrpF domain-containing protein [Modestobacter marinus]
MQELTATWMRGGTSKCWVFDRADLDDLGPDRASVLLRVFGSPDPRQVDGVGGATSTTSKAVILAPATTGDVDVDYTFAQVGINEPVVDWGSNCGNCSAVVGMYALRRGWVRPTGELTTVRVRNTNTGALIVQQVPTPGGQVEEDGDEYIPGVPFPGVGVRMWFPDPAGLTTGALLPTGSPRDKLLFEGRAVEATLVDAGAPVAVLDAAGVGLTGSETPAEITARPGLLAALDGVRRQASVRMGLSADEASAERAVPKLAIVAGGPASGEADLTVRMLSMGDVHPALAITGSVALTMAAITPGTLVADHVSPDAEGRIRLATPSGVVVTHVGVLDGTPAVAVTRTARRIADAVLALPGEPSTIGGGVR